MEFYLRLCKVKCFRKCKKQKRKKEPLLKVVLGPNIFLGNITNEIQE